MCKISEEMIHEIRYANDQQRHENMLNIRNQANVN